MAKVRIAAVKKDAPSKMKFKVLKRRLGLSFYRAVGLLESLWWVTTNNAPEGDIGQLSNEEIAAAIEWEGDPDELIKTLLECEWLDADDEFRLVVHDWSMHVPNWLKAQFKQYEKTFADLVSKSRPKNISKNGSLVPSLDISTKNGSVLPSTLKSKPSKKKSVEEEDPNFILFWNAFPKRRRTNRAKAREAWEKAITKAEPESLIAAAAEYAASSAGKGEFAKMPSSWLNGECWHDEREAWNGNQQTTSGRQSEKIELPLLGDPA